MDFTQNIETWAKGDTTQGFVMLGIGLLLGISLYFIFNHNNPFFNGMLIPIGLLFLATAGYGSFLAFSRMNHAATTIEHYEQNPTQAIAQELEKAEKDGKSYTMLKPIWIVALVVSIALYFIFTNPYYKGLSVSLAMMFGGTYLIDAFLHNRLEPFLAYLKG